MFDVIALGELLIDFTPHGFSESGNPLFEWNPGGAPANVLATLAKLGAKTAFIGKVGEDQFGQFLASSLKDNGMYTEGLKFNPEVHTTLAFVHLTPEGERSFSFYRNPGADTMLVPEDIPLHLLQSSRIFHFGSVSLTQEPARSATYEAVKMARKNGLIVSYDPNLRPPLWKSLKEAEREIKSGLQYADILKISEEELEFITKEKDLEKGTEILEKEGVQFIFVTLGSRGTFYRHAGRTGKLYTYNTKVVDTTGAGDAFLGGVLYKLKGLTLEQIEKLTIGEIEDIVDFANAIGALVTTRKGAIPAIPSMEEIQQCRLKVPKLKIE